jgi:dihydrofolate reductase
MGRKTWESFPKRPLPGRTNIVVTRDAAYRAEGALVAPSLDEAFALAARETPEEVMVLGGAAIYAQALPLADRIYLTRVHGEVAGDTHFPDFDRDEWTETVEGVHPSSAERPIGYSFLILDRKRRSAPT